MADCSKAVRRFLPCWSIVLGAAAALLPVHVSRPVKAAELATQFRRPVALQLSHDEARLFVANHRSGTLSIVDVASRAVVQEVALGEQISDIAWFGDGRWGLAADEAKHQLILLRVDGPTVEVVARLAVNPYPVDIVVASDQSRAFVASLWSRRLSVIDLSSTGKLRVERVLDLPLAPRKQLLVNDDARLIVADSFGGKLAVVDTQSVKLLGVRQFPAHNIRGLGLSKNGEMLIVSHQMLNELAHTVRNDVHWGLLMSNDLRWLRLDSVLGGEKQLYAGAHMHPLGEAGSATSDPGELVMTADGTVAVTLSGVGEIAVGKEEDFSLHRIDVGRRPTALTAASDGRTVFVANTFDDSISIVDLENLKQVAQISLGPAPEPTLVDRGEILFFDARLSHDNWMSCHSCHTDGHTNGFLNDNFSDRSFGAPKRVLSLLGKADTAPFAWNAATDSLEQQIRNSVSMTMQNEEPATDDQVAALAAFIKTLSPPPAIDRLRGTADEQAIDRGKKLFAALNCIDCHQPPTYTSPGVYDVGFVDTEGNKLFNPPSLRGVGQRTSYFHDNRADSLRDVFLKYRHQLPRELKLQEVDDLTAFLRSL